MTYLQLQTALAGMFGYENPSDLLAQDLSDIRDWIHAAYLECYLPVPPHKQRGQWTEDYFGDALKAPTAATLGVTNGSRVVTGFAFETKYAGSFVQIGERFYRYAGQNGANQELVQPWDGATGSVAATIYYNAVALPGNFARFLGSPSLLGLGPLFPLPGPEAEIIMRSEPAIDFRSFGRRLALNTRRQTWRQNLTQDHGDPYFYHIDSGNVGAAFAPTRRLHVYPLPDRAVTFDCRINVLPARLSADADVPKLPGDETTVDLVGSILLPIARENLVQNANGRRWKGDANGIAAAARKARDMLRELASPQRETGDVIRLARGW